MGLLRQFRAFLWDLDGTLCDSRRDLATAVNGLLVDEGFEPLDTDVVAGHVGRGARNLVTRCLEERGRTGLTAEQVDAALATFDRHYEAHLLDTTVPYSGIPEILAKLDLHGATQGVVSNKPERFSRTILDGLKLSRHFLTIVGGDTTPERKPHPAPLYAALSEFGPGYTPDTSVLIGDSPIDVETARRAGAKVLAVGWGFGPNPALRSAEPDWYVDSRGELLKLLLG